MAHLCKVERDKVSQMIEDGFTYPEIIEEFAKHGIELNEVNLCNWKPGGARFLWVARRLDSCN